MGVCVFVKRAGGVDMVIVCVCVCVCVCWLVMLSLRIFFNCVYIFVCVHAHKNVC